MEEKCKDCQYREKLKEDVKRMTEYQNKKAKKEKEDAIFRTCSITILIMTSVYVILKLCI